MPWCPKCKNEYREGVTVCAECGCELVMEEETGSQTALIFGEEKQMSSLKKFLEYNKLSSVTMRFDEAENVYELLVDESDLASARKIVKVFLEQQEVPKEQEETSEITQPYINSAEKAEENKSSAWTLLLVGCVGLVIMILGAMGVLPFRVGNPYMFYGVMSAIFILFVVMGVISLKNAKLFAKKAESENSLRDTLLQWCRENLTVEKVDSQIPNAEGDTEETLYFKRYEVVKKMMNYQFMNLDQGFLEKLIDDEVYDMVFDCKQP